MQIFINFVMLHLLLIALLIGLILSAVLHVDESQPPFLLVLDARTMAEMARVEFPGIQWHKDVHGIFVPASALE